MSHFNYLRDNTLLTRMHVRTVFRFSAATAVLLWRRLRAANSIPVSK